MRICSHKGCQTCIVQANCSCVCDAYKKSLKRKYDINVEGSPPLDQAESNVAQLLVQCGQADIIINPTIKYEKDWRWCYIETETQIQT